MDFHDGGAGVSLMICSRNLELLPEVQTLKPAFQSMALLDTIIEPERWLRYYGFAANFSPDGSISLG
jgi:hypothetical protein